MDDIYLTAEESGKLLPELDAIMWATRDTANNHDRPIPVRYLQEFARHALFSTDPKLAEDSRELIRKRGYDNVTAKDGVTYVGLPKRAVRDALAILGKECGDHEVPKVFVAMPSVQY